LVACAELPGVLVEQLDITDRDSVDTAMRRNEDRLGPTDVLLDVAASVQRGTLDAR
jgi:NADP-dependent 3-hydroxy acid dehydrogenase YdfG